MEGAPRGEEQLPETPKRKVEARQDAQERRGVRTEPEGRLWC